MVRSALPGVSLMTRFGLAGVANTLLGFAVIATLDLGMGVYPPMANAVGYLAGFGVSYFLNHSLVFRSTERPEVTGPRYAVAVAFAFACNQLALAFSTRLLGASEAARMASQLAGMTTYTVTLFVCCRFWVFRPSR